MVVMMPKNEKVKRRYVSKRVVECRRRRVLELRLAGLSPPAIAAELRKERVFEHTIERQVWSDIHTLNTRAELEQIEPGSIGKDTFQRFRDSTNVISQAAHKRFVQINDEIARVGEEIAGVDEQLQEPGLPLSSRGELVLKRNRLVRLASKLRSEARDETRIIISINKALVGMPRKLGFIPERQEVGMYDDTTERMIEAIENQPDPERRKRLIEAAELLAGII